MAGGGEPRLGIDVGGTTLRVGVVVGTGVVWEHRHTAHFSRNVRPDRPKESLEYVLDAVAEATRPALERHPGVRGIGLAVPGFITLEEAEMARENNVCLEITSRSGHNITNGHVVRMAKLAGAKMVVDTDSHAPRDLISRSRAIEVAMGAGLDRNEASAVVEQHALVNERWGR